jgi:hypothetical protein
MFPNLIDRANLLKGRGAKPKGLRLEKAMTAWAAEAGVFHLSVYFIKR